VTRRVAVTTGARSEYGLLRGLIRRIAADPDLELQLIVTGSHLSPMHGSTIREIEADGVPIAARVDMQLASDSSTAVSRAVALGVIGIADALARLRPHLIVLLGDRYEILAAAIAAMNARVPIVHIHGGEATEGAIDEAIRHAVTKMAHLHLVAAEPYRARVLRMGESPDRVSNVGAAALDALRTPEATARQTSRAVGGQASRVVLGMPPRRHGESGCEACLFLQ
jgi:UDP-hydrolysing UDP-N-acetyl-D-glucosamine 2-epimerase